MVLSAPLNMDFCPTIQLCHNYCHALASGSVQWTKRFKRMLLTLVIRGRLMSSVIINSYISFASERTVEVRIGEALSHSRPSSSCVPQGSILKPLFLVTYVNDFSNARRVPADELKIYRLPVNPAIDFYQRFLLMISTCFRLDNVLGYLDVSWEMPSYS